MKAKDLQTLSTLLAEYGMKPGVSTPVGDQKSGQQAKQTKASTSSLPSKSPTLAPSKSPTMNPALNKPDSTETPEPVKALAKDLEKGSAVVDADGAELEIVDMVGNASNPDTVVAKNKKGEFVVVEPDSELQMSESDGTRFDRITKRKNKLKRKIKKVLRAQKYKTQGEPVFEINFNSKELAKGALNAKIACGFEAETVWPNLGEGVDSEDTDWLDDLYWNRVSDLIYDQEGSRALERVEEAYREWLQEEIVYEFESEVVRELVDERKEDEAYLDDYVSDRVDDTDVENYKDNYLDGMSDEEREEFEDWDDAAWARQYVEEEMQDDFQEWLEEQIRENGEAWDDAWERAQEQYDMDDWVRREHSGSWYSLLGDYDIFLYNEDSGGGVEAVASMLEDWAIANSISTDVRAGSYHSGSGVDNTYWRVEDDSSIEGDGAKAEIISPVYDSPAKMLEEMKSLFEYMDSNDAETNTSTGLHVTMSFPNEGVEKANRLKMAVLLGDKYVLKQFGREQNSYTKSQQETLQKYVKNLRTDIKDQKSLDALEEILLGGISAGKFSSINFKDAENQAGNQLIEFRVAGGEDYHLMSDKVMKAVIRYAAVMQAGHDPEAYRRDYIKALFKMIAGKDTVSGDVVKQAQTRVDPESINDKVLSAFQAIASEKHYSDAIEALSDAYIRLADVQRMRAEDPQKELQFEDDETSDWRGDQWRRTMTVAQKYFMRAFAMLASDVASGANRAKPTAAVVASFRQALRDFGLTPKTLWDGIQQSEFYTRFPGQVHDKSEKFASAVNSLLKKQDAKALEPAFTVKFNPGTQRMFMPGPIADAVSTASGNNIFGRDGDAGQLPAQFTPKMFIAIDDSEYNNVRAERWDFETALEQHNQQLEIIQSFKDSIKQNPEKADDYKQAIAHRLANVEKLKKQMEPSQKAMDAFKSKYGFVPLSVRSRSETIGNDWKLVSIDELSWLSSKYNIKFTATESVFAKFDSLPLQEQLHILSKVDKRKLDEAWNKRKTNAVLPTSSSKTSAAMKNSSNLDSFTKKVDIFSDQIKNKFGFKTPGIQRNDRLDSFEVVFKTDAKELMNHSRPKKPNLVSYKLTIIDDFSNPDSVWMTLVQYVERWKRRAKSSDTETTLLVNQQKISSDNVVKTISDFKRYPGLLEAWSAKYKKSIDCNNPKGFSQKAHCAGKKKNETIEAEQDMAALLTAYGTPKKKKKAKRVKEGAVPVHNTRRDFAEIMNKPLLGSDIQGQMKAYFVVPDPSMIREFRAQIAMAGKNVDLRPTFKAFAQRQLHPKDKASISESVLAEARGVTARQPGEDYISDTDPSDVLTIQSIDVFPNDGTPAYDSVEDLQSVLDQAVPDKGMRIDDNNPTGGSKAAIVATVTDKNGDDQYWVRFIKAIPSTGVDNLWKTLRGYKYSKGASRESIPVKPSDMVTPNTFVTTEKIATDVSNNATKMFAGTEHDALIEILNEAVAKARANDTSPISGAAPYFNVLQKYAGEYLGPLALVDGGNQMGDTPQMLAAYDLQTLKGSQLMFPDDTSYELVDSIIKTPDGKEIGVSSKAHTGGGATSSLSGVVKQLTPEIESRYPRGTAIMKLLGTSPTKLGPVLAAKELGMLTDQDVEDFKQVPPGSKDLADIKNDKLRNIAASQGVKDENHPNYRVFFRLLAGIVNQIIPKINADPEFINAMKETLNNNNFIQLLQKGKKVGNDVTMDYYTKYPAVFEGSPKLVNKGYAATMAKDRLGFKLKK